MCVHLISFNRCFNFVVVCFNVVVVVITLTYFRCSQFILMLRDGTVKEIKKCCFRSYIRYYFKIKHIGKHEITLLLYINFKCVSFPIHDQDGNGLQMEKIGAAFSS